MTSEKIRAAFQRAKVRDFYDLHLLARLRLSGDLLRGLVVLKLWQVSDAFDGTTLFDRLKSADYGRDDLQRLLRPNDCVEPATIVAGIQFHFKALRNLTDLEREVVADARKGARNAALAERLHGEIRRRFIADEPTEAAKQRLGH